MAKRKTQSFGLVPLWAEASRLPKMGTMQSFWQVYLQAVRSMIHSPVTFILTVATICMSLVMLALFVLLLENAKDILTRVHGNVGLTAYLKEGVTPAQELKIESVLADDSIVESVRKVSREEALKEFSSAIGEAAFGLEKDNPLPAYLDVRAKIEMVSKFPDRLTDLKVKLEQFPEIELVQLSDSVLNQLSSVMRMFRSAGVITIGFLVVITAFIIINTIKLGLFSHREEIQIMRLVGATDFQVGLPFVMEGILQGFAGAGLSISGAYLCFILVRSQVYSSSLLQLLIPEPTFLSPWGVLLLVTAGMIVGLLGSLGAVRSIKEVQE